MVDIIRPEEICLSKFTSIFVSVICAPILDPIVQDTLCYRLRVPVDCE